MWPSWNLIRTARTCVMRLTTVFLALAMAACAAAGHDLPNSPAPSADGGSGRRAISGNGDGGSGM
jgi:hypothetical protein